MKKALIAILLLLAVPLAACSHIDNNLTQPQVVYRDAGVEKSDLAVYLTPTRRQNQAMTALFFPFWISQDTTNHDFLGRNFGRMFHQNWTSKNLFPTLAFDETLPAMPPKRAIAEGMRRGADLVVIGYVPYFFAGSDLDDTALTIHLRIYDVASGDMIWDMEQAARVEYHMPKDWVLVKEVRRMSDAPMYQAINAIADDMAVPIASWLPNPGFAGNSRQIVQGLTAPLPAPAPAQLAQADDTTSRAVEQLESDLAATAAPATPSVNLKIEFDVDKADIRPASYPLLNELGKALTGPELSGRKVFIGGHTDSDASDQYNLELSRRRASAVKRYLMDKFGIAPNLIRTEGFGESRPIAPNDSPANKQLNRRVEVRLDK